MTYKVKAKQLRMKNHPQHEMKAQEDPDNPTLVPTDDEASDIDGDYTPSPPPSASPSPTPPESPVRNVRRRVGDSRVYLARLQAVLDPELFQRTFGRTIQPTGWESEIESEEESDESDSEESTPPQQQSPAPGN